jgi:uncharacterized protein (TIGR02246 family)
MEAAWNAADGQAYGAAMTENAHFIDVWGAHHTGRRAIASGHQAIFESIYRGSQVRYELTNAREIAPGVVLIHAMATLNCPSGPLAGVNRSKLSLLLKLEGERFYIEAFHNTLIKE